MTNVITRRAFANPLFIVVAAILIIAVLALPAAMQAIAASQTKLPAPIRVPLSEFNAHRVPSFTPIDSREFGIQDQDIGTDESLTIPFARVESDGELHDRDVLLHIAYYDGSTKSGLRVSHTPEVCYRQGGATINNVRTVRVPVPGLSAVKEYEQYGDEVTARLVDISLPGEGRLIDIYLFVSNGEFYHDRERLRFAMSWASEPRVYFAKFEVSALYDESMSRDEATAYVKEMIAASLPVFLEDHLPSPEDLLTRDDV